MRNVIAVMLAAALFLSASPALRAQEGEGKKTESFGEGRIIRADGTKIRVSSFSVETAIGRVAYSDFRPGKRAEAELLHIALNMVRSVQARELPTFWSVAQATVLAGVVGGIVGLIVSNPWGGPWRETWPAIGAGTAACAAAGAVVGLAARRYRTVYANPDTMPKPIIKLTMGPVAPRTPGLSLSVSY